MAQIITARLSRSDAQPWGFRLQGGKDFGTPLVIQKVNTGSIADKAGLIAGDAVVRINQTDLYNLRHKDAQDCIVKAGPSFELVVQRGGATWKPTITPLSSAAASPIPGNFTPVTKTSLAANKQPVSAIGTGHNTAARPFVPPSPVRSIVNKQYNSPVAMYSDETIAETLTSQAEVLAGGCLGVNFKKNEKVYNPEKSEVLKALQENDSEPEPEFNNDLAEAPTPVSYHQPPQHQQHQHQHPTQVVTKHVTAPVALPTSSSNPLPPGQNICADCERLIVGVFVRIKDKNLHVECFKCATCGTSLKNQGYYNLNNKLYCDVHARLAAMNSPPPNSNGLAPVTYPPKNLGASTISSALNAHAGNLNGNHHLNEITTAIIKHSSSSEKKFNNHNDDDNNNSLICDNRSISETDCSSSSLSSSDKENDSRPSSSLHGNINKSENIITPNGTGVDGFLYRTMNGRVIKSVIPPGKGIKVNYKVPSNISGPKPFSYTQQPPSNAVSQQQPPMAAPKSPSSYPPPNQPAWSPPSFAAPPATAQAPKPVGPVQGGFNKKPTGFKPKEFIDIEKCNGKPREEEEEIIYSDSDEEFDPQELVKIAKPPPSNFIWPPPMEEQKVPIAAPLYTPVPETQHITAKPCTYRPLEKPPQRLSTQNLQQKNSAESAITKTTTLSDYECLNVESNQTAITTSTSNASSESEYKMYQTQNNPFIQQHQHEHEHEIEKIELRKTPPPIELPKDIKTVEFVEPEPGYKAETFLSVFSTRKQTWQKMTETVVEETLEDKKLRREKQQQLQQYLKSEASDENPENSEIEDDQDEHDEEVQQINESAEEDNVSEKHVGPYDGTYYQLAPSNIPQPVPKGYQSDLQKALVYTSDKPYQIRNMLPTPEPKFPCLDLYEKAVREAENEPAPQWQPEKKEIPKFEVKTTTEHRDFPYNDRDVRQGNTLLSSMMRTASPKHVEFVKSNIIEEVPLPDEADAYFPPPISMEPNEPYPSINSYRTKSPFVNALITVPDRPFTPFGREIMSQLSFDLPSLKNTFSNALNTAPDESFNSSSYVDANPIEYSAKVYERMSVEATAEEYEEHQQIRSIQSQHTQHTQQRSFLPKIQPWSTPSEQIAENTYVDAKSNDSTECIVSDSRRCSEVNEPCCMKKNISDLLKFDEEEEEFDPDKPAPNAPYPKRNSQPSPFEGMQVRVTNKMTSSLHKADVIPDYQRKWFNLPTQNPPQTPEPEELRENIPVAFKEWSHRNEEIVQRQQREVKVTFAEKPPIPHDCNSRRGSVSEKIQWMEQSKGETSTSAPPPKKSESYFPIKGVVHQIIEEEEEEMKFPIKNPANIEINDEEHDELMELKFPTHSVASQTIGGFPIKGIRKNSLIDLPERQKVQFERQKSLRQELEQQQQKLQNKQKVRQQQALENMQRNYEKIAHEVIREEIQQNHQLTPYEQEQEYKRQLELEREQRQKEMAIKEQQAKELEYQRQMEQKRLNEEKLRVKRERELQLQTQREMEYRKQRDEQEEYQRVQQEERDREMRRQQDEIEKEIRRQQEQERREAEERETRRQMELKHKEERDRELARIEAELKEKREEELKRLEQEIREKREQRIKAEQEAEVRRNQERKAREDAEREAKRLEEEAARVQKERERQLQNELKLRQKQEADRKQREEMELFNIEEERKRNETAAKAKSYQSSTYQQQHVWPPSNSSTPAPQQQQQHRQIPIIKMEDESELDATKFHFEPLDEDQRRFMAGIRPPSTCYSPPTDEKPFPSIPYYQQHLAFYEAQPDHTGIFDPRALSPTKNRSRSPAFGPPPNPLLAFVNKTRDPVLDESGIYLCGERLLSPIWYEKGNKKIPPAVQRRIHPHGSTSSSSSHPPPKIDLEALKESIRKHKSEFGTKPPPTPPPLPNFKQSAAAAAVKKETQSNELPPKASNKESMIATDLLKESVDRLNINSQSADFRKNASGVIAAMLEARMMKKKQPSPPQSIVNSKFDDPEFLPPPPPLPSTKPPNVITEIQELPLPPPPSPCKIPSSILTPPLSSDENDFPQKTSHNGNGYSNNNGGSNEKVIYRHKKHHHANNNQSSDKIPSTFGINKPELSTHARDRRSYIEKNNNNNNNNNNNCIELSLNGSGSIVDKDTLDSIANGIANGQHPVCDKCKCKITRGPFVTALGKTWCPAHFLCVNPNCKRELMDIGFVEEKGDLYCEYCFESFLAPPCCKCNGKIKGDCLNAIGKKFHPECFKCTYCGKLFGNNPFFLEEGEPYCEGDWNELFTTKCFACGFPVEAGDRWVEALNNNYHSQCFNCTYCKKNLEGQSFFAKGGRPFCKNHAR